MSHHITAQHSTRTAQRSDFRRSTPAPGAPAGAVTHLHRVLPQVLCCDPPAPGAPAGAATHLHRVLRPTCTGCSCRCCDPPAPGAPAGAVTHARRPRVCAPAPAASCRRSKARGCRQSRAQSKALRTRSSKRSAGGPAVGAVSG
eukprot:363769-Chlamydomonas_euryale.AAC.9